jgi:hypothetical protein
MRAPQSARGLIVAAIVVVLSAALSPRAWAQSSAGLGLAGGATVPLSTYSNDKNTGYHLGLVLTLKTSLRAIMFRVDGDFSELKYKQSSTKEQIWMANANLVMQLPATMVVTPYVLGGVGVYNRRRTLFLNNNSTTDLGFNGGAGLRFGVGEVHTFVEVRYHAASGRNDIRMVPITFGVSF